jgi:hypothetical protein
LYPACVDCPTLFKSAIFEFISVDGLPEIVMAYYGFDWSTHDGKRPITKFRGGRAAACDGPHSVPPPHLSSS